MGAWCFDLPSSKHFESFKELKKLTDDETLIGFGHLEAEEGASFLGRPLHQFESKIVSTIKKNIVPSHLIHHLFPDPTPLRSSRKKRSTESPLMLLVLKGPSLVSTLNFLRFY